MRIAIVTGTRADYGILHWPIRRLKESKDFDVRIIATGTHLSPSFGMTVDEIVRDGFDVDARVEMLVDGAGPTAAARSFGLASMGFADAYDRLKPDLLMVLGDRYEILAAASIATLMRIPLAHLCGGDVTEGANDDMMRHAISKMAHIHFPSNAQSAARLIQMGEAPERVHAVGSPALDHLRHMTFLDRASFCAELGLPADRPLLLVTMHPETLLPDGGFPQLQELLTALAGRPDCALVLTGANADADGGRFNRRLTEFAAQAPNAIFRLSLGQRLYFNALKHCAVMLGNSSSGLYEAPSFALPAVNIGDRQAGRLRGPNVIDCAPEAGAIAAALARALDEPRPPADNPYGDGHAAERIVRILQGVANPASLLRKSFVEL
ncbi:MAG TPA: UDP-N-acetylglucosamine 2-epimerase [Magnetospirillum sp.]|nr:UDP-N-acetylglucosamine 2-epimerase [Magnetospirillum sp.]